MLLRSLLVLVLLTVSVTGQAGSSADALYRAIRNDDLAALTMLAREGANLTDAQGQSPLMWASAYGSVAAVRILLDAGAQPKAATPTGLTALHLAATDAAKARLLIEAGADINAVSPLGRTPLLLAAAATDSAAVVRLLLDRGANVNVPDHTGLTPLAAAAVSDNEAAVDLLLARGAELNPRLEVRPPATALMGAAGSGNAEMVRALLARGADVNAVSADSGATVKNGPVQFGRVSPLHFGVMSGNAAVVRALLGAGASVDARDVRGMTPLMFAIATDRANPQIVRALLAAGADTGAKSNAGESAVTWAEKFRYPEVLAALSITPSHPTPVSHVSAGRGSGQTARTAVERSLPLLRTGSGRTMTDGGCVACHAQPLTGLAWALAQSRGWAAPVSDDLTQVESSLAANAAGLLQLRDGGGLPDTVVYNALLLASSKVEPNRATDALVHYLAAKQRKEGNWRGTGASRAPIQDGDFSRTAMAIRALRVYGVPAQSRENRIRVERAAKWLAAQTPISTEDRVMQLLGLLWADASRGIRESRVRQLLALQKPDGGWAQTRHLESDAYATGQVVYTLRQLGVAAATPQLQRAVAFLLETQRPDGSWYVRSRAMKIQPYFESGFPYGHDQWISQAGTAWAAIALTVADLDQPVTTRATR